MAVLQATSITGGLTMHGMAAGFMKLSSEGAVIMDTNAYATTSQLSSYLSLSGGTLTGPVILNDAAYFRGTPTYGFRFNNNADTLNNMTLTNASGNLFVRGQIYIGGNGFDSGTQVVYNSGTWGISISGNAASATNLGADYTADDWFRATADNNPVKFYGNSYQMTWRTDGTSEAYSGIGGYPFVWTYGGSSTGNRRMLMDTSGNLWTNTYGWLHSYFQLASSAINTSNIGSQSVNYASSAGSASSASSVPWTGVSAGIRSDYDLQFRPPDNVGSYGGIAFATAGNSFDAGYFLVRGGPDSDVYTQNGITLVADTGWLTLAQRTRSDRGVRIMTGATSTTRIEIVSSGMTTVNSGLTVLSGLAWNAATPALNVGGNGDARIQVRHIWGKQAGNAGTDHLWLQYANAGNHVQIGETGGGNNLYVSGDIYMNGYFAGSLVATRTWVGSQGYVTGGPYLPTAGGTMSGDIILPNDTAVALRNAAATAGFRPDDQWGNLYLWNSQGGFYTDATSYFFRNSAGSSNWMTISGGSVQASGDMRAPIFYDSQNTAFYLDPNTTGTSLRIAGGIAQDNIVGRPYAVWGSTGTTGAVVIKFPGGTGNYGMVHAVIDIYEYDGNAAATVIVGGHNWGGAWYNINAEVIGQTNKPVRVGVKDGRYCIVIGNGSSSWSYGQVVLRKIQNGTYYSGVMDVAGGYSVAIESDSYSWISGDLRNLRTPLSFSAGSTISAGGDVRAPIFYDSNNTGYYGDFASTSRMNSVHADYLSVGQGINTNYRIITNGDYYANGGGNFWAEGRFKQYRGSGTWHDVIDTGNIGSQSVSYASSAGNADTVDGYHAAAFPYRSGGSSGYYQVADWMQFNTSAGLYWPSYYNAHIEPNVHSSYGSINIRGSKNGWAGINFSDSDNNLMANSNESGFHKGGYGWQFRWENGTLYCHKNSYGGGTSATVLDSSNYTSYAPSTTGSGASGTWGINITGSAGSAGSANYAGYLPTAYVGGQQLNPQVYFNNGIGVKVAMTASITYWNDTLWINGYSGGDVPNMCALHFIRNGQPRFWISSQSSFGTSYGTSYEVVTDWNSPYALNMNQYVRTTDGPTFAQVYSSGWFRNYGNQGIYNQDYGVHFYAQGSTAWSITGSGGNVELQFRSNHNSTVRGYVYANTSNEIGFLRNDGNWALRCDPSSNVFGHNNLYAYYDVIAYYSDERLKTKTGKIDNALTKIMSLEGFSYVHNDLAVSVGYTDNKKQQIGLSAQEVQKIAPELVTLAAFDVAFDENGNEYSKSGENYLTIKYDRLVPILVEAIKEQQKQIEELKAKLN